MGLFGNKAEKPGEQREFYMGIEDCFHLQDSTDMLVVGRVRGTIKPGDAVYIHNWTDNSNPITMTTVRALEIDHKPVNEATDKAVAVVLENVAESGLIIGCVLATRNVSSADVHTAYVNAIGNAYVGRRKLDLADDVLKNMSITDLAEAWRLYNYAIQKGGMGINDDTKTQGEKINRLAGVMIDKILGLSEMHVVFSEKTGEPYLFSNTIDNGDKTYKCTPPEVLIVTDPYLPVYKENYSKDGFEIRTIENGENKKGIYNFLGEAFYLDGACGVRINGQEVGIMADKLVPPPSYEGLAEINIPVTNPDVMRWILLIGEMGKPETKDEDLIYRLYYSFFLEELIKTKFLIPMKKDKDCPEPDENGKTVITKDTKIAVPTLPGKGDRPAVRMYTDWRMLHEEFDEEWSGIIMSIGDMIKAMDCAINITDHPAAGCYVDESMYNDAKARAEKNS